MKKLFFVLVTAVLLFSLTGCQERKSKNNSKLEKQASSTSREQADLKLAVTAKLLCSDGSWYLTEQKQEISVKPEAMKLTTKEPFGEVILTVQNGQFAIKKNPRARIFDAELFKLMTNETICKAMLELYLAELKIAPAGAGQTGSIKFEGQTYDLVFSGKSGIEVYKNKSTQRKDLVISQGKEKYVLYGYNYLKNGKAGYFSSKIDVYLYSNGSDRKLVAQYNCRRL